MRITVDIDSDSKLNLLWKLSKGLLLCRKIPEIKRTSRGYHLIWYGLKISFKRHFLYRKFIGDDENRIRLDMNPKRLGQVLFTEKRVFLMKGRKLKPIKYCRICRLPLTKFWVFRNREYYCIRCGSKKDVVAYEQIVKRREEIFNSLISLFGLKLKY